MRNSKEDIKVNKIAKYIKGIMNILEIVETDSNKDTPYRVAKMYVKEVFRNINNNQIYLLRNDIKLFTNDFNYHDIVSVKDIDFSSICEHHFMPFFGTVDIEYVPKDKVIGLSKLPKVVTFFSKKPQLQERLTQEIGNFLVDTLKPIKLKVTVKSVHTCVKCRGIEKNCETTTEFNYTS